MKTYSPRLLRFTVAICCTVRPLLTALKVKYESPCGDDIWSAPTADAWALLIQSQDISFNEEEDVDAYGDPRPAPGDLYESLMRLMNTELPGRPLGLLWYFSFAPLMLVVHIQMMARGLMVANCFLYSNIRCEDTRHNLSIISEGNRTRVMQALNTLIDLMPKPSHANRDMTSVSAINLVIWHPVWVAWHYTALSLAHQDALLTSGIVEYSLPGAISITWKLGKV
ncbi:C6 zinc finger protein [Seiridium cupressi]